MNLHLLKPRKESLKGQILHACAFCGGETSEINTNTNETNCYGKLYPESMLVCKDGKWMCKPHYRWYYHNRNIDKAKLEIKEEPITGTIHSSVEQS